MRRLLTPELSKTVVAKALRNESKWTRFPHHAEETVSDSSQIVLSDLFKIQRGLATGDNQFFILSREQAAAHQIPSPPFESSRSASLQSTLLRTVSGLQNRL
jgi:hypothetical protein